MRVSSPKRSRDGDDDIIITLVSGDGVLVSVTRSIALQMGTIANLLQEVVVHEIPLPSNIRGTILQRICDALECSDMKERERLMLLPEPIELLLAVNYLDVKMDVNKDLRDFICNHIQTAFDVLCEYAETLNRSRWLRMPPTKLGPEDVLPEDKDPGTTPFTLDQVASLDHVPRSILFAYILSKQSWSSLCAARLDSTPMAYAVQRYMEQQARAAFPKLVATNPTLEVLLHCFFEYEQNKTTKHISHTAHPEPMHKDTAHTNYVLTGKDLGAIECSDMYYSTSQVIELAFIKHGSWAALLKAREQHRIRQAAARERANQLRTEKRLRARSNKELLIGVLLDEHCYTEAALETVYKNACIEWRDAYNRWLSGPQAKITMAHEKYVQIVNDTEKRIISFARGRHFNAIDDLVTNAKFAQIVASNVVRK